MAAKGLGAVIKLTVLSSTKHETNFNDWNAIQNRYNIHCTDPNLRFPKWLVVRAHEWFMEWCQQFHIDHTKYPFVRLDSDGVHWQVDFHTDEQFGGTCASVHGIAYDSRNKKIDYAQFSITN